MIIIIWPNVATDRCEWRGTVQTTLAPLPRGSARDSDSHRPLLTLIIAPFVRPPYSGTFPNSDSATTQLACRRQSGFCSRIGTPGCAYPEKMPISISSILDPAARDCVPVTARCVIIGIFFKRHRRRSSADERSALGSCSCPMKV